MPDTVGIQIQDNFKETIFMESFYGGGKNGTCPDNRLLLGISYERL